MTDEQRAAALRKRIRERWVHEIHSASNYADVSELLYLEGRETRDGWDPESPGGGPPYSRDTLLERIRELRTAECASCGHAFAEHGMAHTCQDFQEEGAPA